jgi:hypothetical protein
MGALPVTLSQFAEITLRVRVLARPWSSLGQRHRADAAERLVSSIRGTMRNPVPGFFPADFLWPR